MFFLLKCGSWMGLGSACRAHARGVHAMCVRCLMIEHHLDGPHLTDKQRLSSQSYGSMFWPSTAIGPEVQYLKSLDWGWQPWDFYLQRFPITLTPNGTSAELNLQTVGVPQHNQHDRSHCATLSYVVHRVCVGVQLLADMTDSHSYTQSYGRSSTAPNSGSSLQHGH